MSSIRSKNFGVYLAKQFIDSVSEANLYFTMGKSTPWINDLNPQTANTSDLMDYDVWTNMIGGKRITGNDLRHVIPRFNWANNTVYNAYDSAIDSNNLKNQTTPFYVLTDDFNVYKCISNNKGNVSSSKPTSTNPFGQFQTSDKYIWKYMYSISTEGQQRFLTETFMPVATLSLSDNSLQWQVQENAIDGAIHNILITDQGYGFTSNNISVTIKGDGRYANAFATRNVSTLKIDSITVDNKGSGYTYANVTVTGTTGSGCNARAVISPSGGHGSNPLYELGGSYVMIDLLVQNDEDGKFPINNDFRQYAIIEDPLVYATSNVMSNSVVSQLTILTTAESSSTQNYYDDEWVYQGPNLANATFRGIVVQWDAGNSQIKLSNVEGVPTSDVLTGQTSTATRYISSVQEPDMSPHTGNLLYINNIKPIDRAIDQNEEFKILLSF